MSLSHVIPHTHTVLLYIGGHYVPESCDPTHTQYCCILGDIMSLSHVIPHTHTVLLYIGGHYVPESCDPTHTHSIVVYWGTLCP